MGEHSSRAAGNLTKSTSSVRSQAGNPWHQCAVLSHTEQPGCAAITCSECPCCLIGAATPSWTERYWDILDAAPPDLLRTLATPGEVPASFSDSTERRLISVTPNSTVGFLFSFLFSLQDAQGVKSCQSLIYWKNKEKKEKNFVPFKLFGKGCFLGYVEYC